MTAQPTKHDSDLSVESSTTGNQLDLKMAEILAGGERLWLRGRIVTKDKPSSRRGWFTAWRRYRNREALPQTGELVTTIGKHVLHTDVSVTADGYFDALVEECVPPTRRGWRVARNTLRIDNAEAEGCGLVLHISPRASEAIAIVLPLAATTTDGEPKQLESPDLAARMSKIFSHLAGKHRNPVPVYYLACVPLEAEHRQQEIALALTAMGWPHGTILMFPASGENGLQQLQDGLAKLSSLLAGSLALSVINLQEGATQLLSDDASSIASPGGVVHFINPNDDLSDLDDARESTAEIAHSAFRPTRMYRVTRCPIVFCHGMLAMSAMRMQLPEHLNGFVGLEPFLEERGFRSLYPQVSATGGVAGRAHELKEQILSWTDEPVNLIAHSMGGLDCRHLITHLDMAKRVRSLTTIATPHRGTYLAEWFIQNYRHRFPLLLALEALGMSIEGFRACRRDVCEQFNATTPDAEGVHYFSYGGEAPHAQVTPFLRRAWTILTPVEGPNDGMVSVASSRWGEYLGTIGADHFAQLPESSMTGPNQKFDALGFCLELVEELARRGF